MGHHNHSSPVQKELHKIENKNPFPHVGWIILNESYEVGSEEGKIIFNLCIL